jgi:hypothetical protein
VSREASPRPCCVVELTSPAKADSPLATRAGPTAEEWEDYKPILERLYIGESKTLDALIEYMSVHYSFRAR